MMAFTANDMKKRHGSQKMPKVALYLLSDRILMVYNLQVSLLLQTKNMRSNYSNFAAKSVVPLPVKTGKLHSSLTFDITRVPPPRKKNPSGGIINPLFTRFVRQRRLEISFIHQIGNYYCYMYCKTIKNKYRIKEIQTYIRACNVEFTKGFSYYRI